jgi:hypothetical protein
MNYHELRKLYANYPYVTNSIDDMDLDRIGMQLLAEYAQHK